MTTYKQTYHVTAEDILNHVNAAQDSNKIHNQGKNSVVPGTLLAGLARDATTDFIRLADLGTYRWQKQDLTFKRAIFANSDITVDVGPLRERNGTYHTTQTILADGIAAAKSKLTYATSLPDARHPAHGEPYTLTGDAASSIASSQHKHGLALADLALSLISPVLLDGGKDLVEQHRDQGKDPMYVKQRFQVYRGIERLTPGDTLTILVEQEPTRNKLGYEIPLLGITKHGIAYQATATLNFANLESVLAQRSVRT